MEVNSEENLPIEQLIPEMSEETANVSVPDENVVVSAEVTETDSTLLQSWLNTEDAPPITPGRAKLQSWLYKLFRIVLTDGRILSGAFLCTDSDANVILGMCSEDTQKGGEERMLGLVMVPGRHIVSMEMDASERTEYKKSNF